MKKLAVEYTLKATKQNFSIVNIKNSIDAYEFSKNNLYSDDIIIYESVFILLLNHRNNVIGYAKISQGAINSSLADIRLISKYAIEALATGVILVHNHPSGNLIPSNCDDKLTKNVKDALNLFSIKLLDHIIITDENFYSYLDDCRLF